MKKVGVGEPPVTERFLEVTGLRPDPRVPGIETMESRYQRLCRASMELEMATGKFEGVRGDIRKGAAVLFWILVLNLALLLVNLGLLL